MGLHLRAVRAQVGVGVLEPGDGTMTQASRDCHQCVEIMQLAEPLGRKGNAKVVGVTWQAGGSEDSIPAESIPAKLRSVTCWYGPMRASDG